MTDSYLLPNKQRSLLIMTQILVTRTSQPSEPVDFNAILARVYTQISGAQLPSVNAEREKNGLEPLQPNTKEDSPGSKPDKAFHIHLDVNFSKKAMGDNKKLGDMITQKIDPVVLTEMLKGLSYDNRFKAAAQDLFKTGNPSQEILNKTAQSVLETVPVRSSADTTSNFPAPLLAMITDLAPQFLRKKQVKNETGQLVDTDEMVVDGKKFPVKEVLALSSYPTIQLATTAHSCLGPDKYRIWKQDQGPEFAKQLDKEKKAKIQAEKRDEL